MRDPDWQSDDGRVRLYRADCLDILPQIDDVSLALTDPPFGLGNFVQTGGKKRAGRGKNIEVKVEWNELGMDTAVLDHLRRVAKHRIVWGANFFNCFEEKGGMIVWDKDQRAPNFSKAEVASCTHYAKTEMVRIPWHNWEAARLAKTDHPCERPVELYEWCLDYIPGAREGTVLDPYMGSGSVGVACVKKERPFIGIEKDPDYFRVTAARISKAIEDHRGGPMFAAMPDPEPQLYDTK